MENPSGAATQAAATDKTGDTVIPKSDHKRIVDEMAGRFGSTLESEKAERHKLELQLAELRGKVDARPPTPDEPPPPEYTDEEAEEWRNDPVKMYARVREAQRQDLNGLIERLSGALEKRDSEFKKMVQSNSPEMSELTPYLKLVNDDPVFGKWSDEQKLEIARRELRDSKKSTEAEDEQPTGGRDFVPRGTPGAGSRPAQGAATSGEGKKKPTADEMNVSWVIFSEMYPTATAAKAAMKKKYGEFYNEQAG